MTKMYRQATMFIGLSLCLVLGSSLVSGQDRTAIAQNAEDLPELELANTEADWVPDPAAAAIAPGEIDPSPNTDRGVIPGRDDRIPMNNRDYPWSAVGRIVAETAEGEFSTCTGTLIAVDVVLTNAHCVVTPETQTLHRRLAFQPNLINGSITNANDMAWATEVFLGTDFSDGLDPNPNDWALVKLDRTLGDRYGTLRWQMLPADVLLSKAGTLNLVGYSADFPPENPGETAGVHQGCSILQEDSGFWLHDCDTFGGASGGPILAEIEGDFYVVALHAGGVADENNVPLFNYAVKLDQIAARFQ